MNRSKHARCTLREVSSAVSDGNASERKAAQSPIALGANIQPQKQELRKISRNKMVARENAADALLVNVIEACNLLGGIHPRSLARMEKRGLIRSIRGLVERKLYATADLKALVENLRGWSPARKEVSK